MADRIPHINHSRRTPLPRRLLNVGARVTAAAGFTAAGLTSPAGLISAAEVAAMPGNLRGVPSQDQDAATSTRASLETAETTETQLEYWKRLTDWLQVDVQKMQVDGMMKDSVVINLKPEGAKALAQMDQDNPKNLTTMDFALLAALQRESTEGSLPPDPAAYTEHLAGTYDLLSISDDVARRYAVEPKAAGVVNTYFVELEGGVFALNVKGANVLSTLESGNLKIAIPQETLGGAKKDAATNPAENIPAATPTGDAFQKAFEEKRQASLTQAYAPSETPVPTPEATRTPAEIAEQAGFNRMLGACLGLLGFAALASALGIPVAIGLSGGGGGGGGGNLLGGIRGNRSKEPTDLQAVEDFLDSLNR